MFRVVARSPFDDDWKERDEAITAAVGEESHFAGTNFGERDHGWDVATFEEAKAIKAALETVPLVRVAIQEKVSHVPEETQP